MMQCKPTPSGGRIVTGDTPWGRFEVEWNERGELIRHEMEIRTPEAPPVNKDRLAQQRRGCGGCGGDRPNPMADSNYPGGADQVIQEIG